ncbi:MAG: hypothetical protein AAF517_13795, partial [Planctomycetota bacterium]
MRTLSPHIDETKRPHVAALIRVAAVLVASITLPGCGVGGLISVGVWATLGAVDDGPSNDPQLLANARVDLLTSPSRESLRDLGDAGRIPVCFVLRGVGDEEADVRVEYSRESEDFSQWRPATAVAGSAEPASCSSDGEGGVFWWNAGFDLDLDASSERVRVRVFIDDFEASVDTSDSFVVGNSSPSLELQPSSDEEGEITLVFSAGDAEGDPLRDLTLSYQLPGSPEEQSILLERPLPTPTPAPREATVYSRQWDSTTVSTPTGRRDVQGVIVRLRAKDAFGLSVGSEITIDLRNNRAPEVRLTGSIREIDDSFEIPVPFVVFDEDPDDRNSVDAVLQYVDPTTDEFPELPPEFDDPEFRRTLLSSKTPEAATERSRLRVATPSVRSEPDGVAS